MVKKAKYSSELTEEDHRVINHIILVCATSFSMLLMKYQIPEQLANYWRKKIFNTKLGLAGFCLLLDARSKSSSKRLVSPTQLNNEIARKMHASDFNVNEIDSTVPLKSEKLPDSYLHPRDMRKVLMVCEEIGFYIHIEGKKDIKKEAKSRPGRSKSEIKKIKGRPSRYKIANDIDKFSKVLSKPQARELLNESLLKSNLFYSYLKFISKAFWYALRKDKTAAEKVFRAANISISKYDLEAVVNPIIDKIVSLDDAALEELVDQASKSSIEKHLLLDETCLLVCLIPGLL